MLLSDWKEHLKLVHSYQKAKVDSKYKDLPQGKGQMSQHNNKNIVQKLHIQKREWKTAAISSYLEMSRGFVVHRHILLHSQKL